jgi:hypothetical protein
MAGCSEAYEPLDVGLEQLVHTEASTENTHKIHILGGIRNQISRKYVYDPYYVFLYV